MDLLDKITCCYMTGVQSVIGRLEGRDDGWSFITSLEAAVARICRVAKMLWRFAADVTMLFMIVFLGTENYRRAASLLRRRRKMDSSMSRRLPPSRGERLYPTINARYPISS